MPVEKIIILIFLEHISGAVVGVLRGMAYLTLSHYAQFAGEKNSTQQVSGEDFNPR